MAHELLGLGLSLALGLALLATLCSPAGAQISSSQEPDFWVSYFYLANIPGATDGSVVITNTALNGDTSPAGDLCADIYVFDNTQELKECCGCPITPNGVITLSIDNDLTSNPENGVPFSSGVIKIVSARTCDPRSATLTPTKTLRIWATHPTPPSGVGLTEEQFSAATLGTTELDDDLTTACEFGQESAAAPGSATAASVNLASPPRSQSRPGPQESEGDSKEAGPAPPVYMPTSQGCWLPG